jgi:hypothetical protein
MSNIRFDRIKGSLLKLKDMGIQYEEIDPNIIKIKNADYQKYIIFEPKEIYTRVDAFITFMDNINKHKIMGNNQNAILRIPFFAGCSGYDIGDFISPSSQISIDINLNLDISFEILPADFNSLGLQRFCGYLETIKNNNLIYSSKNNFEDYQEYFIKILKERDWKINTILPSSMLKLCPNNEKLVELFKIFEETQKQEIA